MLRSTAMALIASTLVAVGCGNTTGNGGGSNDACAYPKVQGVSMPCCTGYGADACGANLFCAAYDGRAVATCYPERSRLDMTECQADKECVSGSCDPVVFQCRSLPGTTCDLAVGCTVGPDASKYFCSKKNLTCQRVGSGKCSAACGADADCTNSHQCDLDLNRCRCLRGEVGCDGHDELCVEGSCLFGSGTSHGSGRYECE